MQIKKNDVLDNGKGENIKSNIRRAAKMQKLLEHIAYYSLFIDFAITAVTLISINIHKQLQEITFYLNLALSIVVVVAMFLFIIVFFLSHYDKIIDKFAMKYANEKEKGRQKTLRNKK
ncbi:MAG: hypothetical protein ACP5TL_02840 [Candidatus Micrarchaeia archaeon]